MGQETTVWIVSSFRGEPRCDATTSCSTAPTLVCYASGIHTWNSQALHYNIPSSWIIRVKPKTLLYAKQLLQFNTCSLHTLLNLGCCVVFLMSHCTDLDQIHIKSSSLYETMGTSGPQQGIWFPEEANKRILKCDFTKHNFLLEERVKIMSPYFLNVISLYSSKSCLTKVSNNAWLRI